ncbi:MAG: Uncharacterized protein H6Q14_1740 [Bacteroidetes bacterium]|nr:Uncharacterized protein [Bacteroidota bacterium]
MKEFTNYEREILKKLISIEEKPGGLNVLGNIIDTEFYPNYYIELKSESNCQLIIRRAYLDEVVEKFGNSGISELVKQVSNKLLFIVKLFEYLEREGQIYLAEVIDLHTLGSKFNSNDGRVSYELVDKDVSNQIYKISRRRFVVNDSLIRFVNHDFKTDNEIKTEKELRNTTRKINWTAFGVLVSLLGIVLTNILKVVELNKEKGIDKVEIVNEKLKIETDNDTTFTKVSIDKFNDTLNIKSKSTISRR